MSGVEGELPPCFCDRGEKRMLGQCGVIVGTCNNDGGDQLEVMGLSVWLP